jgi:hypothetical protein
LSKKLVHAAKVRDIYVSPLFRLNLAYAESLKPDAIYVLSAKHGLLPLDDQIEPYELTLNTMGTGQIRAWASGVVSQLAAVADLKHDLFVFLAGDKYRKFLVPHLAHFEVPMDGLTIGRQLQFLSRRT